MTKFLEKNKISIGIILGALIVGGAIYFSSKRIEKSEIYKSQTIVRKCENLPELTDGTIKLATKIIDGDTFLIEGGYSVRIFGVDADERGYPCYGPAKGRLEELILNKEVKLEKEKENFDQYCRYLRYVFVDGQNVSFELVKEGLAVARFSPENIKYREEISLAEKEARENKIGCKWGSVAKVEKKN